MTAPQPGDFAVIRTNGWQAALIRFGTRSAYNHAAFFVSPTHIVEAQPGGAVISPWTRYHQYTTVTSAEQLPLTDAQREHAPAVGMAMVGTPYGWWDIVAISLLQIGVRPRWLRDRVRRQHNQICSQLVDTARFMLGDHLFRDGRLPQDVAPGDLAHLLGY